MARFKADSFNFGVKQWYAKDPASISMGIRWHPYGLYMGLHVGMLAEESQIQKSGLERQMLI